MGENLYLVSSEGHLPNAPLTCTIIRHIRLDHLPVYLLVAVEPAVNLPSLGVMAARYLVLAPRHVGVDLSKIAKWPACVHLAWVPELGADYTDEDLRRVGSVAWGELFNDLGEAEQWASKTGN